MVSEQNQMRVPKEERERQSARLRKKTKSKLKQRKQQLLHQRPRNKK
jgi:hypothetical protein